MKKLILAEDDKFLVRVYKAKLEETGIETRFFESGEGVFEAALKDKPDCIVMDLIMPGKDGFETLRELKSDLKTREIPVIILTALKSDVDRKRCMDLGCNEFLEKDEIPIQEVMELIKKHLGG